ncbi:hypothetical protein [Acidianus manzaensis]|uniref:Uncharacterized protein n=1 Tax=Acidianus manzaensis TaxID=282676 RepID=A0A1W6K319_9CREN|nr:hypothetical protein [Acidianus manzaensis]ARM76951.1 hypothetical protein B6F84_13620 [Acidianus manzaensis]
MKGCNANNIIDNRNKILFRYVDENEYNFIIKNGYVWSINFHVYGGTYWTYLFTNDEICAKDVLKLDHEVQFRVASFTEISLLYIKPPRKEDIETIIKDLDLYIPQAQSTNFETYYSPLIVLLDGPIIPASIYDIRNSKLMY